MSRSYKKHPIYTDRARGAKYWKRQANRRVRHYKGTLENNHYRKLYCSWEIHDWISRWSKAEAVHSWEHPHWHYSSYYDEWWHAFSEYRTREEMEQYWAKYYRRK